jgi:hypothetical protein
MRRVGQACALAALALATLAVAAPGAAIAATGGATGGSTKPTVVQAAWFWKTVTEQANPPVVPPATAPEPSGVPSGDLAVAYSGDSSGGSSKMTALAFDLSGVQPGSTIDSFTFSVTIDSSTSATNVGATAAPIVACLPTRLWSPADGGDYTNAPPVDCTNEVKPTVSGNTLTFVITELAQSWVDDVNLGVGLVNDPKNTTTPFQAVFTGAKTVTASMTSSPPVAAPPSAGAVAVPPPATSTGSGTGSVASGPVAPAVPMTGALAPPPATTTGPPAAAPQVAPSAPSTVSTKPVAAIRAASALPGAPFWIAMVAILGLLVLTSLVLGDPIPARVAVRRSRIDRVAHTRLLQLRET